MFAKVFLKATDTSGGTVLVPWAESGVGGSDEIVEGLLRRADCRMDLH